MSGEKPRSLFWLMRDGIQFTSEWPKWLELIDLLCLSLNERLDENEVHFLGYGHCSVTSQHHPLVEEKKNYLVSGKQADFILTQFMKILEIWQQIKKTVVGSMGTQRNGRNAGPQQESLLFGYSSFVFCLKDVRILLLEGPSFPVSACVGKLGEFVHLFPHPYCHY